MARSGVWVCLGMEIHSKSRTGCSSEAGKERWRNGGKKKAGRGSVGWSMSRCMERRGGGRGSEEVRWTKRQVRFA